MGIGKPFKQGNTLGKGRPPGSSNRKTIFQEEMEKDAEKIIQKVKERALEADRTAMRLCIERLVPVAKEPNARFQIPALDKAEDLTPVTAAVTRAFSEGELSAQEGETMVKLIDTQRRNIEVVEFEARIKVLEDAASKRIEDRS